MKKFNLIIIALVFVTINAANISAQSNKKIETIYTDLAWRKCVTVELDETGSGYYRGQCPGVGGYKLELIEADIRQTIDVISPNGKKSELNFRKNVSYSFSETGEKAEWRVVREGRNVRPMALIVRHNAAEDVLSSKETSRLIVVSIRGDSACITDVVEPVKNANVIARKLADKSGKKPCKFPAADADPG